MLKVLLAGTAAAALSSPLALPAGAADASKAGVYEISEIYVLPSALASKEVDVPGLIGRMVDDTRAEDGLLAVTLTQQLGQRNNYTLIEQWRDQASLDRHVAADHTKRFFAKMEDLTSGPVYQRVFGIFQ